VKPISEWTDDELRAFGHPESEYRDTTVEHLAAEVLRLRAETDEWSDRMDAVYAKLTARAEKAEAALARLDACICYRDGVIGCPTHEGDQ
jgi:hypothetical protein